VTAFHSQLTETEGRRPSYRRKNETKLLCVASGQRPALSYPPSHLPSHFRSFIRSRWLKNFA